MDYSEFLLKMAKIKAMGFVPSHREGDTGVGKTLEDLLGITENNISGPDFASKYELKGARKNSVSMLTLFTKAPEPASANRELLEKCGYPTRTNKHNFSHRNLSQGKLTNWVPNHVNNSSISAGEKELHISVDAIATNSCGMKLGVRDDRLFINNNKGVEAYYNNETLKQCFEKKYNSLIYVLAENRGSRGAESFWFNEAYLLDGFSFKRFSELILEGKLKVDLRMGHYPDGRIHDHGTGFRILPKFLPQCFRTMEKIV